MGYRAAHAIVNESGGFIEKYTYTQKSKHTYNKLNLLNDCFVTGSVAQEKNL